MFRQAKQNRTFEDVIFQIQEAILQGELKNGDKLPGERKLKEIFKISRGTLREALRALEQKKLIQIKTGVGGGAIVCQVNTDQMSESLDILLRYQKITLKELAEFREAVEGLVAAKAAQKAEKKDLKQLTILMRTIKNFLGEPELKWHEAIKTDNNFHLYIARIAGNRIFESVLSTVYDNISRYWDRFLPMGGRNRILVDTYEDLEKITEAIGRRDSISAQKFAQNHVRRFNLMMEKVEKATRSKRVPEPLSGTNGNF